MNRNRDEVKDQIRDLMRELFGEDFSYLAEDDSFYYHAGLDSFDFIELIDAVEKEFGVRLPEWRLADWRMGAPTFGGLVDMVCEVSGR